MGRDFQPGNHGVELNTTNRSARQVVQSWIERGTATRVAIALCGGRRLARRQVNEAQLRTADINHVAITQTLPAD